MRTDLGIIVMIKALIVTTLLVFSGYAVANYNGKEYWESIGPKWDVMLNPYKGERDE